MVRAQALAPDSLGSNPSLTTQEFWEVVLTVLLLRGPHFPICVEGMTTLEEVL